MRCRDVKGRPAYRVGANHDLCGDDHSIGAKTLPLGQWLLLLCINVPAGEVGVYPFEEKGPPAMGGGR